MGDDLCGLALNLEPAVFKCRPLRQGRQKVFKDEAFGTVAGFPDAFGRGSNRLLEGLSRDLQSIGPQGYRRNCVDGAAEPDGRFVAPTIQPA